MAYQTGTVTDSSDALNKLTLWLQSIGWTVNRNESLPNGRRVHVSKNGLYVNLRATSGAVNPWGHAVNTQSAAAQGIHLYCGTGYDANLYWNAQPGGPIGDGQTYNVGTGARVNPNGGRYDFFPTRRIT